MKKYQIFLSENFMFLEVKFSIYLNRRVFVMEVPGSNSYGGGFKLMPVRRFTARAYQYYHHKNIPI